MWDNIVDIKVKANQIFIKGIPVLFAVASVFAPEVVIPLLAVAAFLKTKTGQKILSGMIRSEEITGDAWKGDVNVVNEKIQSDLDHMLESDVDVEQVVKDVHILKGGK